MTNAPSPPPADGTPARPRKPADPKAWVLHADDAAVAPLGAGAAAA